MKLSFASNSGTYKQFRYLEEQYLTNMLTNSKYSITCCNQSILTQHRLLQYGQLVGYLEFKPENFKNYTLVVSNFRNYAEHMLYKISLNSKNFGHCCSSRQQSCCSSRQQSCYLNILRNLNLIRYYRIFGFTDEKITKLIQKHFHWLLGKDDIKSFNLPAFRFIDFNTINIIGMKETMRFKDFINIYINFLKTNAPSLKIPYEQINEGNFLKFIESFLAMGPENQNGELVFKGEEAILKFNIGGNSYESLNDLVQYYKPIGNEIAPLNQKVSLSSLAKNKIRYSKTGCKGYQGYEIRDTLSKNYIFVPGYETKDIIKISYGIYEDKTVYLELFDVYIPYYVIAKIIIN